MAKKNEDNTNVVQESDPNAGSLDPIANDKDNGSKSTVKKRSVKLDDSEEIEVISLIPNVSYKDKRTDDMYEWDVAGHVESMTVETLKDMWRNNKGYFKNLWLKPLDERILAKFGLTKTFDDYEFLMEGSSYTKENLDKIVTSIEKIPMGMKFAIVNKIKGLVSDSIISDISIIKTLGRKLDTDFVAFS